MRPPHFGGRNSGKRLSQGNAISSMGTSSEYQPNPNGVKRGWIEFLCGLATEKISKKQLDLIPCSPQNKKARRIKPPRSVEAMPPFGDTYCLDNMSISHRQHCFGKGIGLTYLVAAEPSVANALRAAAHKLGGKPLHSSCCFVPWFGTAEGLCVELRSSVPGRFVASSIESDDLSYR